MSQSYLLLAVFLVAATVFALTPLLLARIWARLVSPSKPGALKTATYECGLESRGNEDIQFNARYYLFGIMFLIFDVEILFLLPFAVVFRDLSFGAFLCMALFLLLLVEGLVWAWAKGILTRPALIRGARDLQGRLTSPLPAHASAPRAGEGAHAVPPAPISDFRSPA